MPPKNFNIHNLTIATRASDQLGLALKRYRARAGQTQSQVAKSAGLRQATISKAEQGAGTTEVDTIYSICAALGLELVLRPRKSKSSGFRPEEIF